MVLADPLSIDSKHQSPSRVDGRSHTRQSRYEYQTHQQTDTPHDGSFPTRSNSFQYGRLPARDTSMISHRNNTTFQSSSGMSSHGLNIPDTVYHRPSQNEECTNNYPIVGVEKVPTTNNRNHLKTYGQNLSREICSQVFDPRNTHLKSVDIDIKNALRINRASDNKSNSHYSRQEAFDTPTKTISSVKSNSDNQFRRRRKTLDNVLNKPSDVNKFSDSTVSTNRGRRFELDAQRASSVTGTTGEKSYSRQRSLDTGAVNTSSSNKSANTTRYICRKAQENDTQNDSGINSSSDNIISYTRRKAPEIDIPSASRVVSSADNTGYKDRKIFENDTPCVNNKAYNRSDNHRKALESETHNAGGVINSAENIRNNRRHRRDSDSKKINNAHDIDKSTENAETVDSESRRRDDLKRTKSYTGRRYRSSESRLRSPLKDETKLSADIIPNTSIADDTVKKVHGDLPMSKESIEAERERERSQNNSNQHPPNALRLSKSSNSKNIIAKILQKDRKFRRETIPTLQIRNNSSPKRYFQSKFEGDGAHHNQKTQKIPFRISKIREHLKRSVSSGLRSHKKENWRSTYFSTALRKLANPDAQLSEEDIINGSKTDNFESSKTKKDDLIKDIASPQSSPPDKELNELSQNDNNKIMDALEGREAYRYLANRHRSLSSDPNINYSLPTEMPYSNNTTSSTPSIDRKYNSKLSPDLYKKTYRNEPSYSNTDKSHLVPTTNRNMESNQKNSKTRLEHSNQQSNAKVDKSLYQTTQSYEQFDFRMRPTITKMQQRKTWHSATPTLSQKPTQNTRRDNPPTQYPNDTAVYENRAYQTPIRKSFSPGPNVDTKPKETTFVRTNEWRTPGPTEARIRKSNTSSYRVKSSPEADRRLPDDKQLIKRATEDIKKMLKRQISHTDDKILLSTLGDKGIKPTDNQNPQFNNQIPRDQLPYTFLRPTLTSPSRRVNVHDKSQIVEKPERRDYRDYSLPERSRTIRGRGDNSSPEYRVRSNERSKYTVRTPEKVTWPERTMAENGNNISPGRDNIMGDGIKRKMSLPRHEVPDSLKFRKIHEQPTPDRLTKYENGRLRSPLFERDKIESNSTMERNWHATQERGFDEQKSPIIIEYARQEESDLSRPLLNTSDYNRPKTSPVIMQGNIQTSGSSYLQSKADARKPYERSSYLNKEAYQRPLNRQSRIDQTRRDGHDTKTPVSPTSNTFRRSHSEHKTYEKQMLDDQRQRSPKYIPILPDKLKYIGIDSDELPFRRSMSGQVSRQGLMPVITQELPLKPPNSPWRGDNKSRPHNYTSESPEKKMTSRYESNLGRSEKAEDQRRYDRQIGEPKKRDYNLNGTDKKMPPGHLADVSGDDKQYYANNKSRLLDPGMLRRTPSYQGCTKEEGCNNIPARNDRQFKRQSPEQSTGPRRSRHSLARSSFTPPPATNRLHYSSKYPVSDARPKSALGSLTNLKTFEREMSRNVDIAANNNIDRAARRERLVNCSS